ncbi:MAG: Hsp70 family protein, partial [Actinocatenispora sp.]
VLLDAAARVGLAPVRLLTEPVAAAGYFSAVLDERVDDGAPLGVFDFGGGTLDVAVVRRSGLSFEVLGAGGLPDLGGVDLDAAVIAHLGAGLPDARGADWRRLTTPTSSADRRASRLLWEDVRSAKETLSRASSAPVRIPILDVESHLTRAEFDALVTPLLARAVDETARVLGLAGCRPDQLAGLFLVGGSSRVPLVARLLHARLGVPPRVLEHPEIAVAEGAARPAASAPTSGASSAFVPGRGPGVVPPMAVPGSPMSGPAGPVRPDGPGTASGVPQPVVPAGTRARRTRKWLLAVPAAVLGLLVGAGVYVFGLHPGGSMVVMPWKIRSMALWWLGALNSCEDLGDGSATRGPVRHPTGDTAVDLAARYGDSQWMCRITADVHDRTGASFVVFTYGDPYGSASRSVGDGSRIGMMRGEWWDTHSLRTDDGQAMVSDPKGGGPARIYWQYGSGAEIDGATDVYEGFLVSTDGDADTLVDLWRDHAG